jgi:hypothetical protein
VGLIWITRNLMEKIAKALVEFKFHCLDNIFMEPSECDEILLCKVLYFVRGMAVLAEQSR